jgi:hypothetical protein
MSSILRFSGSIDNPKDMSSGLSMVELSVGEEHLLEYLEGCW